MFVAMALIVVPAASAQHYDLGGPCKDALIGSPSNFGDILKAQASGDWNRVVELERVNVREGCSNEFRWNQLAKALVLANRPTDATHVLEDMDERGLELNPSPGMLPPEVVKLVETPEFKSTPAGQRLEALKQVSDSRRAHFLDLLNQLPANKRPPERYVAKGACPFECCQYRQWTVENDTVLYAAPGSKKVVGKARKGTRVRGLTGELHLTPEPAVMIVDHEVPKDTIVFLLDNLGEGSGNVYIDGKIVVSELGTGIVQYCFDHCWGETLLPPGNGKPTVWWVKVKLPNGVIGWTDQPDNFGNKDACGSD